MNRLTIAALFLGACSGAHLPPVPAPTSTPAKSGLRPWTCTTPVGAIVIELPDAHGLPLVGISATVLVSGARVTTGCERSEPAAPASQHWHFACARFPPVLTPLGYVKPF